MKPVGHISTKCTDKKTTGKNPGRFKLNLEEIQSDTDNDSAQ